MSRRALRKLIADWNLLTVAQREQVRRDLNSHATLERLLRTGRADDLRVAVDRARNQARVPGGGRAGATTIRGRDAGELRTPAPDTDPASPDPGHP